MATFFSPSFWELPPCDGFSPGEGGSATDARRGEFDVPKGSLNTPARHPSAGGALRITASSSHPSTQHRYASREAIRVPVDERHNRSSKRLLILTLVLFQHAPANECLDVRFIPHDAKRPYRLHPLLALPA